MSRSSDKWTLVPFDPKGKRGPIDPKGAEVIEVDAKGSQIGPTYYSAGWSARAIPPNRQSPGSFAWIEEMVISETPAGAMAGVSPDNIKTNLPLKGTSRDIASSSPFGNDVLVKLVDCEGSELTRYTMANMVVTKAKKLQDEGHEVQAERVLISNFNIFKRPAFSLDENGKPTLSSDVDPCEEVHPSKK